jgi:hypothetical protein
MAAPAANANGQRPVKNISAGVGSVSETVMETNGSYVIPDGFKLEITDWIGSYQGEGHVRIRLNDLAGEIQLPHYFSAAGEIQGDLTTPIYIAAPLGGGDVTIVITQEGDFENSFLFTGQLISVGG